MCMWLKTGLIRSRDRTKNKNGEENKNPLAETVLDVAPANRLTILLPILRYPG